MIISRQTGIPSLPRPASPHFNVGETVKVAVNLETLQKCQEGHGGFNPKMADLIGRAGRVHRITENGDVRVQFPGKPEHHFRWTLSPRALSKVRNITEYGGGIRTIDHLDPRAVRPSGGFQFHILLLLLLRRRRRSGSDFPNASITQFEDLVSALCVYDRSIDRSSGEGP